LALATDGFEDKKYRWLAPKPLTMQMTPALCWSSQTKDFGTESNIDGLSHDFA
jgi:hypothetical protein